MRHVRMTGRPLRLSSPALTAIAGLGLLGDRDAQAQHAGVVRRLDALHIEGLAEEELPRERTRGPFVDEDLPASLGRGLPLRPDGEHVPLDVQVDGVRLHTGQVEVHPE